MTSAPYTPPATGPESGAEPDREARPDGASRSGRGRRPGTGAAFGPRVRSAARSGACSGRAGPLVRLLGMAGPSHGRLAVAAATGALATSCGVALLAISGYLLARASQHPDITALSVAVVAVRGLSVGRGVFRYGERLTSHDVAFRALARMRVAIWRRLEVLAPSGLPAFRSGDLLARLVSDVDATQDLFVRGVTPPATAAIVGAGAVLAAVAILVPAGLALAVGLLAGGVAVPTAGLFLARNAARRTAPVRGQLGSAVTDLLTGAADLHAFGACDLALARAEAANQALGRLGRASASATAAGSGLMAAVVGLTMWTALILGVSATGAGALGRVPLAALTLTAMASFEAVTLLPSAAIALSQAHASGLRITEVIGAPTPVSEPRYPLTPPSGSVTVQVRDAWLSYSADSPPAISGVSLDLRPGRRVALVGPNGAGKSTIAAALLRFRDLDSGSITVNGRDLTAFRGDDARTMIGGCPQDPHLFDASIEQNLRVADPSASDANLTAVLGQVGLADWVKSLPDGLSTQVGPGGVAVSGGQRQRIALARALLADPAVLILDEPTAHLDPASRASVMADVLAATSGRCALLITHDLNGLDQVDEIVVMDRGRVAERGTHRGLLAANGLYRALWQGGSSEAAPEGQPPRRRDT